MATTTSSLRQAVERLLGDESLDDFVTSRRKLDVSWRRVRDELRDTTGVDVTHETLRSWFPDPDAEVVG